MVDLSGARFAADCQACGSARTRSLVEQPTATVARCRACGTAFVLAESDQSSHNDLYNDADGWAGFERAQNFESLSRRHNEVLSRLGHLAPGRRLFDVGAGAGAFLAAARDHGFEVGGNEVSAPAVRSCREQTGIELYHGDDLTSLPAHQADVVTMWCVIAHADDADGLLHGVLHVLSPNGVLYFHTPRWCLIDSLALVLVRISGGRLRSLLNRRINLSHRRLYTTRGVSEQLSRAGLAVERIDVAVAYGFHFRAYLTSIGVPGRAARVAGALLDQLAGAGALPRNTLNVYARPAPASTSSAKPSRRADTVS